MLRNLTRNLHTFLDNIDLRIENKNSSLGKTVLQLWSQICEQLTILVHPMTLKKCKKLKNLKAENMKAYFF